MKNKELDSDVIVLSSIEDRLKYFKFEKMLRDRERAIHKMKNGEYIKLVDMSDEHLDKAIKFFEKKQYEMYNETEPDWCFGVY